MADVRVDDTEVDQIETEDQEVVDGEAQDGDIPAEGEAQPEANEVVVTIGEEKPAEDDPEKAPGLVNKLRKLVRERERELREVRRKLNDGAPQKEPELGPEPTLSDHGYDEDKFKAATKKWIEDKIKSDERKAKADQEAKIADEAWQSKLSTYQQAKTTLGATDFEETEAIVLDLLDTVQQGIIVQGAKDPAIIVYALGKNEAKAKELAAIKNPVDFAFAIARMEGQVKVAGKRPTTQPEGRISGNGQTSGALGSTLEKLRSEASRTGDYSKVLAYKNKQKG